MRACSNSDASSISAVEVHLVEDSSKCADTDSSLLLDGKLELEVELTDHYV